EIRNNIILLPRPGRIEDAGPNAADAIVHPVLKCQQVLRDLRNAIRMQRQQRRVFLNRYALRDEASPILSRRAGNDNAWIVTLVCTSLSLDRLEQVDRAQSI